MALPVAPPPKPNDVAILGWSGLTVRIAWTLLAGGVRVRPDVLRDARAHVLYQLDPTTPLPQAEDLATRWVEAYIARARGQQPHDPWPGDWEMPLSPRWRRAIAGPLDDDLAASVLRKHYADNRSISWLETQRGVARGELEAVQNGLREAIRKLAVADGLPLGSWEAERLDRLLKRLAAWAPAGCPPPLDVAEGCHREHVATCPRCDRLHRLLKAGVIEVDDLFPPTVGARPSARARVLALQIHPDARQVRRSLVDELPTAVFSIGEDLMLLDANEIDGVVRVLRIAAEVGMPSREHIRGALLDGPGTWTPRGLIGPLPGRVAREVLQRSWGTVDGLGLLPEPLPEPPSPRRWWATAAVAWTIALLLLLLAAIPPDDDSGPKLTAEFTPARGGTWVAFDVPDDALVTLIGERDSALFPILASKSAADKAPLATGDGTYRIHVAADAVMIAVSEQPLAGIADQIREADGRTSPLEALAEALDARGTVRVYRR